MAIADELGVPSSSSSAGTLVNFLDLSGPLTNLGPRKILIITDIDAIRPGLLEPLIRALSNFQLDIKLGTGPSERLHSIRLPQFTFIGTTSKPWLVDETLRRWCVACQFAPYTPEEATQIVMRIARDKSIPLDIYAAGRYRCTVPIQAWGR